MSDPKPVIVSDGNSRLVTIDRVRRVLSDNPADYPKLTAEHLMHAKLVGAEDTQVRREIDAILPRDLRARSVGAFLFKILRDAHINLLYDVYLLQREGFVQLLKETNRPDSLSDGLTTKELERAWEIFEFNMQLLAKKGQQFRRRQAHIKG